MESAVMTSMVDREIGTALLSADNPAMMPYCYLGRFENDDARRYAVTEAVQA